MNLKIRNNNKYCSENKRRDFANETSPFHAAKLQQGQSLAGRAPRGGKAAEAEAAQLWALAGKIGDPNVSDGARAVADGVVVDLKAAQQRAAGSDGCNGVVGEAVDSEAGESAAVRQHAADHRCRQAHQVFLSRRWRSRLEVENRI